MAFDLDDTLFDRRAAAATLLEGWLGDPHAIAEILARDDGGRAHRGDFFCWLAASHPAAGADGESVARRFRRELPACISPDPEVVDALAALRDAGLPLGLLSNGNASFQMAKLRACGADRFFRKSHMLFSASIGFRKPDVRAFDMLSERMGLSKPDILFVGDDPCNDIEGAGEAGMRTCQLLRPGRCVHHDAGLSIRSLAELAVMSAGAGR